MSVESLLVTSKPLKLNGIAQTIDELAQQVSQPMTMRSLSLLYSRNGQ